MGSPQRISHMLYQAAREMTDPGDAGTIRPNKDLQICEITSAAAETRTVARPTKGGIRLVVRLYTDGGDVTCTVTGGLNAAGDTIFVLADAGDMLELVSVKASATTYRWQELVNIGSVSLASTSPSASVSSSPSASVSASPSASTSSSPSSSPSAT